MFNVNQKLKLWSEVLNLAKTINQQTNLLTFIITLYIKLTLLVLDIVHYQVSLLDPLISHSILAFQSHIHAQTTLSRYLLPCVIDATTSKSIYLHCHIQTPSQLLQNLKLSPQNTIHVTLAQIQKSKIVEKKHFLKDEH